VLGFNWLKRRPTARRTAASQQPFRRPTLCAEQLEDRLVPSPFTNGNFEGAILPFSGLPQDSVPAGWNLGPPLPSSLSLINVTNLVDPSLHLHAADGSGNYMRFQSTATNGTKDCLFQDFDTVVGQQYTVTFSVAITNAGVGNSSAMGLNPVWDENGANQTTMGINNFYFAPTSSQGPIDYQTFSFIETASSTTTRIDFHGTDTAGSILLDDVSVVPVTSPGQPPPAGGAGSGSGTMASLPTPTVSVAFPPRGGEVLAVVTPEGALFLSDATGLHQLAASGIASASVTFGPFGQMLDVVTTGGALFQADGTGVHQLLGSGIASASMAFGPTGQVMELVTTGGALFQVDAAGVHQLAGGGIASASVAFGPTGQVTEVVTTDHTLVQVDASGPHTLLTGIVSASVAFPPTGEVLDVIALDNTLVQIDAGGVHNLGKLV
jgi:hypothetical protein